MVPPLTQGNTNQINALGGALVRYGQTDWSQESIMARKNNHSRNDANAKNESNAKQVVRKVTAAHGHNQAPFARFATTTAHLSGKPGTFTLALLAVFIWAATGPLFGYSDTWQLVINTSTTIITFLMVFLIQNTQNRDAMALQIKLAELIFAMHGAKNKLATAEDLSEEDLETLHEEYRKRADEAFASLTERRSAREKQKH
jgi:low affinity Fe/Cu permease